MRLVPDQKPDDIARKLRRHLDEQGFADIEISPSQHFLIPSRTPIDHPAVDIIAEALRETYEAEPIVFPNIGGAGPNYIFTDVLQAALLRGAARDPRPGESCAEREHGSRGLLSRHPHAVPRVREVRRAAVKRASGFRHDNFSPAGTVAATSFQNDRLCWITDT